MQDSQVPAPTPKARRRWLKWMFLSLTVLLLLLGSIVGLAWWWSGQADSLGRTLERVAQWLPDDQKLEARGVQGTLRQGGSIDWLRWSSPDMQVQVQGTQIGWSLPALLSRTVHFGRVDIESLSIHSTPSPQPDTPTEPLQSLVLPVQINLPLHITRLVWEGTPAVELTDLDAHYRYSGGQHALDLNSLRYADGLYQAKARLQAAAPMQIHATLQGKLATTLPLEPDKTLQIEAQASVDGTLATTAARLQIEAKAHAPSPDGSEKATESDALSADVSAVIYPWRSQLLEQAKVELHHINAAWFLPNGPQTDLNGSLQAGPQEQGWEIQAAFQNLLPGAWDQQALPVRQLDAMAHFDGISEWTLDTARIELGKEGDAHVQAQGRFNTSDQVFEGQATLAAINPAELYSVLDPAPLSGSVQAHSDATQQVQFKVDIQAAAARLKNSLHIQNARMDGTWQAPLLQLRNVQLAAFNASVQSQELDLDTESQHIQGVLDAQLPGAHAQLQLQASPTQGNGQLQLDLPQPQALIDWLAHFPSVKQAVTGLALQGSAHANLQWQGGWEKLQQRLQNPTAPVQASGLQVQAAVQVPQLHVQAPDGMDTRLTDLKLTANGSPEALRVSLNAHAQIGEHQIALDTDATAGLQTGSKSQALDWQASITQLLAQWRAPGDSAPWKATLASTSTIVHTTTGNPVQSTHVKANAGQITITPPSHAGEQTASISWEPLAMHRRGNGSWSIQSKGRLQGLPLMWADTLNPHHPPLASMGVSGDLLLQGQWDIDNTGREMRAHALLERASGDVRFSVDDSTAANVTIIRSTGASARNTATNQVQSQAFANNRGVRARIQTMRVQLDATGNDLRTQLVWTTERAGQISADIRSQVRHTADGIVWPNTAPLSGNIRAALPNIGVWAFFAPPGWRATGSFDANLTLSGTRKAPNWMGSIQADQLSVQSLLDGVDLRDGQLRAQLHGTRLDITQLILKGGEGSHARILGQSGNLTAAPKAGGTLTGSGFIEYDPMAAQGSSGLRMDLQAAADHLQVLVRADRQLSVSGKLQANLLQGQFKLNGDLTVDRAAIILADDSAPTLGSDVHITSAATRLAAQQQAAQEAAQAKGSVQASKPPILNVHLNLGNDFALQGYGITTRLEGAITVTNGPRITGEIHTVNGRYRAWGQSLDVESGTIRFNGPYANPSIDIVAIRPNIDVRAGVKVTGSANNPRVALFSDPDMSDAEKLSWIVMGRSASGGGAEAVLLQQAALALLSGGGTSGNFASQLGFDEIGFKGPSDDGEQGAALTVGKRLSKDLYVTYEQSLSGAMGTLYIFYDLSRRLTLRAQTGEQSAVDLIYTKVKD